MKTFGFYFKKGLVLAKMSMKGKSLFTRLLLGLYLILSFAGKLFLFTRPLFLIADNNLSMMIVEGHDFEINKLFEGVNSRKRYSSLLLSTLFIEGIALATAITFAMPYFIWGAIPNTYYYELNPMLFGYIFSGLVLVMVFALAVYYSPIGYVTCRGKDLSAGDILYLSKQGNAGIKGKVLALNVVYILIIVAVLAIFVGAMYLVIYFLRDPDYYDVILIANFIVLVLIIGMGMVDVFVLSAFKVALLSALYALFFDSVQTKHIVVATKGEKTDDYVPLFSDDKEDK